MGTKPTKYPPSRKNKMTLDELQRIIQQKIEQQRHDRKSVHDAYKMLTAEGWADPRHVQANVADGHPHQQK